MKKFLCTALLSYVATAPLENLAQALPGHDRREERRDDRQDNREDRRDDRQDDREDRRDDRQDDREDRRDDRRDNW